MLDINREDFVTCLSEILNCTRQTASAKFNGAKFTESEIAILVEKFNITAEELKNAIIKD